MLGAVAGFLSILVSRLERVIDRHREFRGNSDPVTAQATERMTELMKNRMFFLNRAILLCVVSAWLTASLLVVSFAAGLAGFGHGTIVAALFGIALLLLMGALSDFAREVRIQTSTMHFE